MSGVADLYRQILGRDPDPGGLAYWEQQFGSNVSPEERQAFINSANAELANRSPEERAQLSPATGGGLVSDSNVTTSPATSQQQSTTVADLYRTLLGRDPDPEGLAYWNQQFGSDVSPEEVETFKASAREAHSKMTPEQRQINAPKPGFDIGTGTSTTTNTKTIDPSKSTVSENFASLINRMNEIGFEAAMQEYQEFSGTRYAPQNDIEKAIFASLSGSQTPTSFQKSLDAFTDILKNLGSTSYDPTKATTGLDKPIELSPYTQAVVDVAKRKAGETSAEAGAREMAQLAKAGAFGSSGADLLKAQRAKNLENLQSDIQAQGLQAAYESALAQRVKESALELDAQRLSEASKEFGAELGLKGLAQELAAAQGLTNLGQAQGAYGLGYGNLQLKGADQLRDVQQQPYDFGYQQWIESRNYPYQQATFLNTLMRGMPVQAPTYNSGQDPFSTLLQGLLFGYGMTQPPK